MVNGFGCGSATLCFFVVRIFVSFAAIASFAVDRFLVVAPLRCASRGAFCWWPGYAVVSSAVQERPWP
jgi:hypothetical protein